MLASVGIVPAIMAAIIAFVPSMLYILPLIWLDRYDPEPLWLLALAFGWGSLVAVIISFVFNTVFSFAVYAGTRSEGLAGLAGAVISAPLIEEGSKGVGLLILLIFFRRYFDDILDGIVFAGVIALGFATVENVLYYGNGLNAAYGSFGFTSRALTSFLVLFTLRGIFSPFAHATFTSMTGIGCGIARESHNTFVRLVMPVIGYVLAVTLHATWNGMSIIAMIVLKGFGIVQRLRAGRSWRRQLWSVRILLGICGPRGAIFLYFRRLCSLYHAAAAKDPYRNARDRYSPRPHSTR